MDSTLSPIQGGSHESPRDANALKRDVDRRLDSLRGETDRQLRDGERRVSSLEPSRDTFELLVAFCMPLVAAASMIIILVIAVIVSREQRQGPGEPEQRSPSSIDAPLAGSGGPLPPGFVAAGTHSDDITAPRNQRHRGDHAGGPGNYFPSTVSHRGSQLNSPGRR